jgi:hypothetical protein
MNAQFLNDNVTPPQIFDKLFSSWRVKFLLFVGSLIVAMFLASWSYANYNHVAINELWEYWPLAIFFFPSGLPFSSANVWIIFWPVYIAMIVAGIWMKNVVRSRILFFIFLLLLILNIAGCAAPPKVEITIF